MRERPPMPCSKSHHSTDRGPRESSSPTGYRRMAQNFRNEKGQNFRNRQRRQAKVSMRTRALMPKDFAKGFWHGLSYGFRCLRAPLCWIVSKGNRSGSGRQGRHSAAKLACNRGSSALVSGARFPIDSGGFTPWRTSLMCLWPRQRALRS